MYSTFYEIKKDTLQEALNCTKQCFLILSSTLGINRALSIYFSDKELMDNLEGKRRTGGESTAHFSDASAV